MDEVIWHELCLESAFELGKSEEAKTYLAFLMKKYTENVEYMQKYKKVHDIKSDRELYTIINKEFGSKIAKLLFVSVLDQEQ